MITEQKALAWETAAAILLRQCRAGGPLENVFDEETLMHIRDVVAPSVQQRGAIIRRRRLVRERA